jgi:hypothetical protein
MQFIEFYITTYNSTTERVIETILVQLADAGMVKKWKTHESDSTLHWTVTGSWAAYSTVSAVDKKKFISEAEPVSFSLEHFEED